METEDILTYIDRQCAHLYKENKSLTASLREANMIAATEMDKNLVLEDRIRELEERLNEMDARAKGCTYCRESGV